MEASLAHLEQNKKTPFFWSQYMGFLMAAMFYLLAIASAMRRWLWKTILILLLSVGGRTVES